MNLTQIMAQTVAACADLGAAWGGFLGNCTNPQIEAMLDTRTEAETTMLAVAANYAPSSEKTAAMAALGDLINCYAGGN